jgi:SAM-dependent methyltransferase
MARGGLGAEGARPGPRQRNPWRALVEEVMGLHEAYTEREGEFARDRNPIHHRIGGYQFYYLPRNLVRVVHVLDGLPWSAVNPEVRVRDWLGGDPFRVLDLGCGSGAFSMAWLAWIAGSGVAAAALPPVEIVLVDQSRALLGLAQANLEAFARLALPGLRMTIEGHADGMASFLDRSTGERGPFGLVGAAMALNELGLSGSDRRSRSPRTVSRVAARVAPGGVLLLVEPGTHEGYLNAMAVREPMRAETPAWPVLYPCPHGAPCPMMDGPGRRWCHATISLPEPFFFDEALRQKGHLPLRMRELNLSALALQNTASGRAEAPFVARSGNRVVSNPMAGRGAAARTQVVLLCAEDGRLRERPAEELGATGRGDWVPAIRRS